MQRLIEPIAKCRPNLKRARAVLVVAAFAAGTLYNVRAGSFGLDSSTVTVTDGGSLSGLEEWGDWFNDSSVSASASASNDGVSVSGDIGTDAGIMATRNVFQFSSVGEGYAEASGDYSWQGIWGAPEGPEFVTFH